jgi:hypothetical protein
MTAGDYQAEIRPFPYWPPPPPMEQNIRIIYKDKTIGEMPYFDRNTGLFQNSGWYGDVKTGGFVFAWTTVTGFDEDHRQGRDTFTAIANTARMINGKIVIKQVNRLYTSDFDRLIGGGFGIPLSNITFEPADIVGDYMNDIVYLKVCWNYDKAGGNYIRPRRGPISDEHIIVRAIIRLAKNVKPALADLEISYQNFKNPLLDANWSRDINGNFALIPNDDHLCDFLDCSDLATDGIICTVNGGHIWLLKLDR